MYSAVPQKEMPADASLERPKSASTCGGGWGKGDQFTVKSTMFWLDPPPCPASPTALYM
jgi:hypothetical protein